MSLNVFDLFDHHQSEIYNKAIKAYYFTLLMIKQIENV